MEEQVENKVYLVRFKRFAGDNDVACILQFIDTTSTPTTTTSTAAKTSTTATAPTTTAVATTTPTTTSAAGNWWDSLGTPNPAIQSLYGLILILITGILIPAQ